MLALVYIDNTKGKFDMFVSAIRLTLAVDVNCGSIGDLSQMMITYCSCNHDVPISPLYRIKI